MMTYLFEQIDQLFDVAGSRMAVHQRLQDDNLGIDLINVVLGYGDFLAGFFL